MMTGWTTSRGLPIVEFLLRYADMHSAYLLRQRVCLGVCLSVSHSRYCIKTTKPILKLFRPSGSPII